MKTTETRTDFRALCAELIQQLQELHTMVWGEAPHLLDEDRGGSAYLDLDIENVLEKARAALAQPEPQGPTDEDLIELFNENDWNYISPETFIDIARTLLEAWDRPASISG